MPVCRTLLSTAPYGRCPPSPGWTLGCPRGPKGSQGMHTHTRSRLLGRKVTPVQVATTSCEPPQPGPHLVLRAGLGQHGQVCPLRVGPHPALAT